MVRCRRCVLTSLIHSQNSAYAEKFNRPATHGAGGGGSGGGVVGAGGLAKEDGSPSAEDGSKGEKASGGTEDDEGDSPRLTSGQSDPWTAWEKDRMEELLAEVRGHLGRFLMFFFVGFSKEG